MPVTCQQEVSFTNKGPVKTQLEREISKRECVACAHVSDISARTRTYTPLSLGYASNPRYKWLVYSSRHLPSFISPTGLPTHQPHKTHFWQIKKRRKQIVLKQKHGAFLVFSHQIFCRWFDRYRPSWIWNLILFALVIKRNPLETRP